MKKLLIITLLLVACTAKTPGHIQAVESAEDAVMFIEAYQGDINEFRLALGEELQVRGQQAKRDLAIGVIGKAILDTKGWVFDGYEEKEEVRLYKFKMK